jgi:hypothetical protein
MQSSQLYFNQDCPVCGRKMRVRIELLGKEIACGHCTAVTVASDDSGRSSGGIGLSKVAHRFASRQFETASW